MPHGRQALSDKPWCVGHSADKTAPEFREWLIPFGDSGYAVLYQVDGEQAVVLAIRQASA